MLLKDNLRLSFNDRPAKAEPLPIPKIPNITYNYFMKKGFANGANDARRGIDFIGVTCSFVCHDDKGRILLHKRSKNCRDEHGRWDNGGGAHEFGSSLKETVIREIKEEYGVEPTDLKFIKAYDALRRLADGTPTHWVVLVYSAKVDPKKVKNNEPYKIDEIGWFTMYNLPSPLHSQVSHTLESVREAGII
jgi:8-oxo-dGTP diphosphatase